MTESDLLDPFKIVEIKRRRTCEPMAEQIRHAILNGLLGPGYKLSSEGEMVENFQTNRVALSEVPRAFEKEGWITIELGSGSGACVANFDSALDALAESLNKVLKLGTDLHRFVAEAAYNPVMNIVVNAVNQFIGEPILRSKRTEQMHKHVVTYLRNIFEALQKGNAELAKRGKAEHIVHDQCHIEAYGNE